MNSERAEQPQPQTGLAAPGAQLKAQREAMGWTVEQVADQLKLAPRQVVALEEGDFAALPTMAVVRGFIRAYAKVVKLDAAPLVAMIEVHPVGSESGATARRDVAASFSETRFPSMTKRSGKPVGLIVVVLVVLVAAAAGAYRMGYIPASWLMHADKDGAASAPPASDKSGGAGAPAADNAAAKPGQSVMALPAPVEVAPAKPGQGTAQSGFLPAPTEAVPANANAPAPAKSGQRAPAPNDGAPAKAGQGVTPLQSPSVPLISVPPAANAGQSGAAPAPAPRAMVSTTASATPAVSANPLVLTVRQDSWVEIRRAHGAPLIARLVKGGSVETFAIDEPVLLVVGKPGGVDATLRGTTLALADMPPGKPARMNIK